MIQTHATTTPLRVRNTADSSEINKVIRGEISARNAYEQVMQNISEDPEAKRLDEFHRDHEETINYWKTQLEFEGQEPEDSSGTWGAAVEAFVGGAKLLGNTTALKALKAGEEHGLTQYQELLNSDDISAKHKRYVSEVLIPKQERHIYSLEAMMKLQ